MTHAEAKALILAQVDPDSGRGEPQTFLGGLRPYRGILPRRCFHDIMSALRVLGPGLSTKAVVDRDLVSALWCLCELTRLWALEEDGMLRRNQLLAAEDHELLKRWHGMFSYAVMMLLESPELSEAFRDYDEHCAEEAG